MSDHMPERPWLLLPIETKHREFYGKVLLSLVAAEKGFDVLLGEQNAMLAQLDNIPKGIYLDKSVGRTKTRYFEKLSRRGSKIVAWCEEGLVYRDRDAYLHERVSNDSLAMAERFFAWGDVQASDIHRQAPEAGDRVFVTGNPRFDMLRPEFRNLFNPIADSLKQQFGPYILINSNFSRFNHFMGYDFWIDALKQRGTITNDTQLAFYHRWREFLGRVFRGFIEVLPALSHAFPQHTLIVRPHPSEDHDVWLREVADLENVTVVHEDSAIPWIVGAEVVVHNSCTTGLEAFLLDVPVAAYRPATDTTFDSHLPNAVSHQAYDGEELIGTIRTLLRGSVGTPATTRSEVMKYIAALDGDFAADRVVGQLAEITNLDESYAFDLMTRARIAQANSTLAVKPILRRLRRSHKATSYAKQKFPGIHLSEVEMAISQLREVSSRFSGLSASRTPFRHCFKISTV